MSSGLLLAVIFEQWAGIKTISSGAKAGAIIGLIAGIVYDYWKFGDYYFFPSLVPVLADVVVHAIMSAGSGVAVD